MGKKIAKKIRGMNLGAKISLITLATLLVSVFMYEGWFKPYSVHAVAKTYNIDDSTGVTIATGVTTNTVSGTNPTSATPTPDVNEMKTVAATTTSNRTTGTYTAGATMLESIYNTAYATSTTVTGTSYFGRLRDGSGGYTVGFQLFYVAANGTKTNFTGAQATQVLASGASADYTVSLAAQSATVPAGSKLGIRIIYVSGSSTDARVYYGSTASSTSTPGGVVTVDEVAADSTKPTVTAFTVPATSSSLTISGITFTASDNVGVTGYLINESATPPAAASITSSTAPTSYTAATEGTKTLYAWVKDAAGNVSNVYTGQTCTITLPDTTKPTVTAFTVPATSSSLTISGITFTASDNVGVTGYLINESATPPAAASITSGTAPTSYTAATEGTKTLYAWVKDAAGNVSNVYTSQTCTITLADTTKPTVTTFTVPATSSSLTITGITLTASDNVGVTGYLINESATPPAAASITSSTAPTSYTAGSAGAKTLYAWVKDAAGNVSNVFTGRACTITLDTTKPTVTAFTVPATSSSLTISGITFTASDNVGVTGYLINESATPPAAAAITLGTAPTSYTAGSAGTKTLYAWVKDANGNVSNAYAGQSCTITVVITSPLMHNAANVNPTNTKGYGADWGSTFTCATCHAENTSNVKLVATTVATPNGNRNVVFTRMTSTSNALNGVFGNDNRTYAGNGTGGSVNICEVCHRKTTFHRYSANAPDTTHYNNKLCLTCHPHGAGFKGSGHTVPYYATSTGHTGCATGIGCHTNSTPGGTYPTAGTPPDCQACHTKGDPTTAGIGCGSCPRAVGGTGEPVGSVHPDAVGSHPKHTVLTTCTNCHDVGGTSGNADHGKGNRGTNPAVVNLAASLGWSGTNTNCTTASCHANPYSTTGSITSPAWGTIAGCSACHTGTGLFQANGAPNTGGHAIHMTAGAACGDCHTGAVSGTSGGANHANGVVNVANGYNGGLPVTKHAAGSGYSTCTAATCHANPYASGSITTNVWSPTSSGCGACHKNDATNGNLGAFVAYSSPSTQLGPKTASHEEHLNYNRYVCADCHSGAVSGSTGGAAHGNSVVNVIQYASTITKHQSPFTYLANGCTTSCHGAATWGATLGCINCHAASITRTKGRAGKTLAAVTTEFGLAWGHKKTGRGAVTDADCIVCHLEGNFTTKRTSKFHANGNIDLRDPDVQGETPITDISGAAFTFQRFSTSYAAGSRTTTVNNTIANVISQKFCMKCHDSGGAANTTARTTGGTNAMPFGGIALGANYTAANNAIGTQGTIDVATQFATTNASFHPVLGPRNAGYPTPSLMKAPYNNFTRTAGTKANSVVINCFDCHNTPTPMTLRTVSAHGNAVTLRGNATASGSSPTATTGATLCLACHAVLANSYHGVGSAIGSSTNSGMTATMSYGCNMCHGASYNTATVRPVRAQDVHGYPSTVSGATTYKKAFIRGNTSEGYITAHQPKSITTPAYSGTASCTGMGGTICGGSRTKTYTPGGVY